MADKLNVMLLRFKDVDEHGWTLEKFKGKYIVFLCLQGPDSQQFDSWVEPLRAELGPNMVLQPVMDPSPIPPMLWWGVKKMKGSLMRELRPEGIPRVLLDMDGTIFRKLGCMPGHLNLVLAGLDGEVITSHMIAMDESAPDFKAAMQPILAARPQG